MNRKLIFLLLVLFLTASCELTENMWNPYYEERMGSFMVSQDGRYVIFLGKKYHYILHDDNNAIKRLLFSPCHYTMSIYAAESNIHLSLSNDIKASIAVRTVVGPLDDFCENNLSQLGFAYNSKREMIKRITLYGKRYAASGEFYNIKSRLNSEYFIRIHEDIGPSEKIEKAALTPLTMTIDAVFLIGKILITPFANN